MCHSLLKKAILEGKRAKVPFDLLIDVTKSTYCLVFLEDEEEDDNNCSWLATLGFAPEIFECF